MREDYWIWTVGLFSASSRERTLHRHNIRLPGLSYITPVARVTKGGEYRSNKIRKMRENEKEGDDDQEMGGSSV